MKRFLFGGSESDTDDNRSWSSRSSGLMPERSSHSSRLAEAENHPPPPLIVSPPSTDKLSPLGVALHPEDSSTLHDIPNTVAPSPTKPTAAAQASVKEARRLVDERPPQLPSEAVGTARLAGLASSTPPAPTPTAPLPTNGPHSNAPPLTSALHAAASVSDFPVKAGGRKRSGTRVGSSTPASPRPEPTVSPPQLVEATLRRFLAQRRGSSQVGSEAGDLATPSVGDASPANHSQSEVGDVTATLGLLRECLANFEEMGELVMHLGEEMWEQVQIGAKAQLAFDLANRKEREFFVQTCRMLGMDLPSLDPPPGSDNGGGAPEFADGGSPSSPNTAAKKRGKDPILFFTDQVRDANTEYGGALDRLMVSVQAQQELHRVFRKDMERLHQAANEAVRHITLLSQNQPPEHVMSPLPPMGHTHGVPKRSSARSTTSSVNAQRHPAGKTTTGTPPSMQAESGRTSPFPSELIIFTARTNDYQEEDEGAGEAKTTSLSAPNTNNSPRNANDNGPLSHGEDTPVVATDKTTTTSVDHKSASNRSSGKSFIPGSESSWGALYGNVKDIDLSSRYDSSKGSNNTRASSQTNKQSTASRADSVATTTAAPNKHSTGGNGVPLLPRRRGSSTPPASVLNVDDVKRETLKPDQPTAASAANVDAAAAAYEAAIKSSPNNVRVGLYRQLTDIPMLDSIQTSVIFSSPVLASLRQRRLSVQGGGSPESQSVTPPASVQAPPRLDETEQAVVDARPFRGDRSSSTSAGGGMDDAAAPLEKSWSDWGGDDEELELADGNKHSANLASETVSDGLGELSPAPRSSSGRVSNSEEGALVAYLRAAGGRATGTSDSSSSDNLFAPPSEADISASESAGTRQASPVPSTGLPLTTMSRDEVVTSVLSFTRNVWSAMPTRRVWGRAHKAFGHGALTPQVSITVSELSNHPVNSANSRQSPSQGGDQGGLGAAMAESQIIESPTQDSPYAITANESLVAVSSSPLRGQSVEELAAPSQVTTTSSSSNNNNSNNHHHLYTFSNSNLVSLSRQVLYAPPGYNMPSTVAAAAKKSPTHAVPMRSLSSPGDNTTPIQVLPESPNRYYRVISQRVTSRSTEESRTTPPLGTSPSSGNVSLPSNESAIIPARRRVSSEEVWGGASPPNHPHPTTTTVSTSTAIEYLANSAALSAAERALLEQMVKFAASRKTTAAGAFSSPSSLSESPLPQLAVDLVDGVTGGGTRQDSMLPPPQRLDTQIPEAERGSVLSPTQTEGTPGNVIDDHLPTTSAHSQTGQPSFDANLTDNSVVKPSSESSPMNSTNDHRDTIAQATTSTSEATTASVTPSSKVPSSVAERDFSATHPQPPSGATGASSVGDAEICPSTIPSATPTPRVSKYAAYSKRLIMAKAPHKDVPTATDGHQAPNDTQQHAAPAESAVAPTAADANPTAVTAASAASVTTPFVDGAREIEMFLRMRDRRLNNTQDVEKEEGPQEDVCERRLPEPKVEPSPPIPTTTNPDHAPQLPVLPSHTFTAASDEIGGGTADVPSSTLDNNLIRSQLNRHLTARRNGGRYVTDGSNSTTDVKDRDDLFKQLSPYVPLSARVAQQQARPDRAVGTTETAQLSSSLIKPASSDGGGVGTPNGVATTALTHQPYHIPPPSATEDPFLLTTPATNNVNILQTRDDYFSPFAEVPFLEPGSLTRIARGGAALPPTSRHRHPQHQSPPPPPHHQQYSDPHGTNHTPRSWTRRHSFSSDDHLAN